MWRAFVILALAGISASAVIPSESEDSRIVSGSEATEGQFPYVLYVRGVTQQGIVEACGGSIIHRDWGLSSARCVAQRTALIVSGGSVNRNRPRFLQETYQYFTAPGYDVAVEFAQPNDIGLIRFSQSLTFSANAYPIRLQRSFERERDFLGVQMNAAGWGLTSTNGEMPDNLNWVTLSGIGNYHCDLLYNFNGLVQDSTVCAIGITTQSICAGDGGGPLTFIDRDRYITQLGVSSFIGNEGCNANLPNGFVRVGYYHDWFRQITGISFEW